FNPPNTGAYEQSPCGAPRPTPTASPTPTPTATATSTATVAPTPTATATATSTPTATATATATFTPTPTPTATTPPPSPTPTPILCVRVTATAGNMGPTFYATLKAAFDAINAGTHQGAITILIQCDTTETASAVLNATGGPASYTSVSIQPSGGAARTVSGALDSPLIDLNGATNVTIDGLNSGGNALTIDNTSATASASTIRFINDASNNTVTRCTVKAAGTSTTGGTVFFSTAAAAGNTGNTISNNTITNSGANFPVHGIFSLGTSALPNSGTITGNNIQDVFSATVQTEMIALNLT